MQSHRSTLEYTLMNLTNFPRIYSQYPLKLEQEISFDEEASNHILKVLRFTIGDQFIVFDSCAQGEFLAVITAIVNKKARALPKQFYAVNRELPLRINLGQGISRGEKMDFTIQKAVELGAHSVTPLFTEFCNVKLVAERLTKRVDHWQKVAISAAEQSRRCFVPPILAAQKYTDWLATRCVGLRVILHPDAKVSIRDVAINTAEEITLLVGPEGGFSNTELMIAQQNGFLPVNLGPRVLRTETAALAAIAYLGMCCM
jgi:16S rRNA (uracil1498-N3)-methyltransferase